MVTKLEIKEKYNLNQEDLDWLIDILNPNQYQKVKSKDCKTDILYKEHKKDGKTYIIEDTKKGYWYLNYDLIYLPFRDKCEKRQIEYTIIHTIILKDIYNCKITLACVFCGEFV